MRPRLAVAWVVWGLVAVALVGVAAAQEAQGVFVDVRINGHVLPRAGLLYGDRTYVRIADVASVLEGRFVYDPDLRVAFVNTGRYAALQWEELVRVNPKLRSYQPMSPLIEGKGVHYGAPGTHLTVVTTPAGVITGFQLAVSAAQGSALPWFDQAEPGPLPGSGTGYTHTLQIVHPELIRLGGPTEIAWNGLPLRMAPSAILWFEGELYVRLRDLAVASGGGVGWDPAARIASAKVVPGTDLDLDKLASLNPEITAHFKGPLVRAPGGGIRYGADGPSVVVVVNEGRLVEGFEIVVRGEASAWRPWFDQAEGEPQPIGETTGYSQTIYLSPGPSQGGGT